MLDIIRSNTIKTNIFIMYNYRDQNKLPIKTLMKKTTRINDNNNENNNENNCHA
jgi:hypothetical protein